MIANREPHRVFLVDNCAYSYAFQQDNGIPIIPYHEGKDDQELKHLEQYLYFLNEQSDPSAFNKQYFKTHILYNEKNFTDALGTIMGFEK